MPSLQCPSFLHQEKDPNFTSNLCRNLCFQQYVIRIRAREEVVLDEKRMKCSVMRLGKIDFRKENELLLKEIARYGVAA